jgi:hypothetical protein
MQTAAGCSLWRRSMSASLWAAPGQADDSWGCHHLAAGPLVAGCSLLRSRRDALSVLMAGS